MLTAKSTIDFNLSSPNVLPVPTAQHGPSASSSASILNPIAPAPSTASSSSALDTAIGPAPVNPTIIKTIITTTVSGSPVTESASLALQAGLSAPELLPSATTVDPSGTVANSSASIFGTQIIFATSAISDYITASTNSRSKTSAIKAVRSAESFGIKLRADLGGLGGGGGGGRPKSCSSGHGLLGDLLGTVSCAVDSLDHISGDIEGGIEDIEDLKNDLKELDPIAANLPGVDVGTFAVSLPSCGILGPIDEL